MLWETLKAARDLGRLHEIAVILIRFGFGDLVNRLGLGTFLERAGKVLRWKSVEHAVRMDPPERVRCALEELGPTFIKLGQILATRVDLFPPEWIREFEKLQDEVPPVPFDDLKFQLEEDLGLPVTEVFKSLNTDSIAAGSIAQVHYAQLDNGEEVILKVRRPNIRAVIEADLRVLTRLAHIAEKEIAEFKSFHPTDIVQQFKISIRRELDLAQECRNAERIARNLKDDPNIVIPRIYWDWTSERLNVQQYIKGIPGRQLDKVEEAGLDREQLAINGVTAVLHTIVVDGVFHADPHPGNAFYLPGNRIAFIDFGMVGRLTETRKGQVIDLLHGLLTRDTRAVIDVLLDWAGDTQLTSDDMTIEIESFLDNYHGATLKALNLSAMLRDITVIMRDHELVMPPDLTLLFKAFISLEGMGRQLYPPFDIVAVAKPQIKSAIMARYAPDAIFKRGWRGLNDFLNVISDTPRDIRRLLRIARRGALQINLDINHLEQLTNQIDYSASRITVGLVTSALIIGSSIVMTVSGGPTMFGLPLLGFVGFVGAGIGGV
ncbi:MAG: AarF/UbiB family protein, partial [Gammaproteobacteria bacterium]